VITLFFSLSALAQSPMTTGNPGQPTTISNAPQRDTNANKSNTSKWKDEEARITFTKLNSARVYVPDTSLHTFQRLPFLGSWGRDLGNLGAPVNNLFFTPENHFGPTLGYHVFDNYRMNVDSLGFYNTTRPYSVFGYSLGSKLEQYASIFHTQNIKPNWNFAVDYRKLYSTSFYKDSRNNDDNASLTTNYLSINKHYQLYAAMSYNKEQHDESGGLAIASELTNPVYTDKSTMDAAYQNDAYSITRSPVSNVQRDFTFLLKHSYTWGNTDTLYNADSTQFTYYLHARFSISHTMKISTEKHTYLDESPDSTRYLPLFNQSFVNNGSGYYTPGVDSVEAIQKWGYIDNKVMLNGFVGKEGNQLRFSAGLGNRVDQFSSQPALNTHDTTLGVNKNTIISNYLEGELIKEALHAGEWQYSGSLRLYLTGQYAGNLMLNAAIGRQLKGLLGNFVAGFQQQINSAPYSYTTYENQFTTLNYSFGTETINQLYATLESPRFRLSGGVRNYFINNYIYINEQEVPAQYTIPFTISQAWIRKIFRVGNFFLDNELTYQQLPASAPVNVPALMGRHQFSYEYALFHSRLKIATGLEVRYNTSYKPAGYDALLNKFFYQSSTSVSNPPELAVFLNFRIKRFRAFIMGDNLQQLLFRNTILYVGTPVINFNNTIGNDYIPVYAAPDALLRFGFSWVLVN
jgi:hypothetical protein